VRLTMTAMFFVSLLNIILDFLLVFGSFSFDGFGYRGIAFAAAISMSAGTVISFFLLKKSRWTKIFSGTWHVSADLIRRIAVVSWPAALIQISWSAATIIIYNILSRLHDVSITAMAALTNGLRIEAIIFLRCMEFHTTLGKERSNFSIIDSVGTTTINGMLVDVLGFFHLNLHSTIISVKAARRLIS